MSSWRSLLPALVVACVACNAIVGYDDFAKLSGTPDAGDDPSDDDDTTGREAGGSSSGNDAQPQVETGTGTVDSGGPKRCDPSKPFGAPTVVQELDGDATDNDSVALSRDELEIFWLRFMNNTLRSAKRASVNEPWGTAGTIVMTPKVDFVHTVTKDGLRLFYAGTGAGQGSIVASRADRNSAFGTGTVITEPVNTDDSFEANDESIVFIDVINSAAPNESNLFTTTLTGNAMDNFVEKIQELDEPGTDEWSPVVNASLTNLYFMRGRTLAERKVMVSRRPTGTGTWGAPVEQTTLKVDNPYVNWVSDDDCVIYLTAKGKIVSAKKPL